MRVIYQTGLADDKVFTTHLAANAIVWQVTFTVGMNSHSTASHKGLSLLATFSGKGVLPQPKQHDFLCYFYAATVCILLTSRTIDLLQGLVERLIVEHGHR